MIPDSSVQDPWVDRLCFPNIVNDLPAPVIPYAKAVELTPLRTFSMRGMIAV